MDKFPPHCFHPTGTIKLKQLGLFNGRPLFVVEAYFLRDVGVYLFGRTAPLVKGSEAE